MQTLDGSLLEINQRGDISYDVAISNAREPELIRQRSAGRPAAGDCLSALCSAMAARGDPCDRETGI
jgi:hypothetical protein